jgi:hypothetical protein
VSLKDNLDNIAEYDRQIREQKKSEVVSLSEVRYLKRSRKDQVTAIQNAPRGETR